MYPKYRLRRSSFCLAPLAPTLMRVFFLYEKGLLFRFSFLFVVQFFVRCRFFLTDFLSIIPWYRFFFRVWFRWSFEFPSLFLSILSFDFFSIDNFYQFFLSDFFFFCLFIFSPAPPPNCVDLSFSGGFVICACEHVVVQPGFVDSQILECC